jgi:UDP-N-acetylglucosamine/UDP-N-acetylgalactosamine 4-epimerase
MVTGAAGFIGSNLCAFLARAGHDVVGLDNFSTGRKENIQRVAGGHGARFRFVEGDIRDRDALREALVDCDLVVHLAAQGSVPKSFADPMFTNDVNVGGFLNTLQEAASAGARAFIYASSCSVYGDTRTLPITESEPPSPLSPYAASKLANDLYAATLAPLFKGTHIVGLRFFNIFGSWQDPQGDYAAVIPKWIDLSLRGQQPLLYGDGSATRDFCHVDNVSSLIEALGRRTDLDKYELFNVGTGVATSLMGLYRGLVDALHARGINLPFNGPRLEPWRDGEILHSRADITKARERLGFETRVDLTQGLQKILDEQYCMSTV